MQEVVLKAVPPVHAAEQTPVVGQRFGRVGGQLHAQLLSRTWPVLAGQEDTQAPPHTSVFAGQAQRQVVVLNVAPPGQVVLTQTPLHAWKPTVHSHRNAPVVPTLSQKRFLFA